MPNPPKPNERKRLLGNPSHRPIPDPLQIIPRAEGPIEPLRPLGEAGQRLWDDACTAGNNWVSPVTDSQLLQLVCEQIDRRAKLMSLVPDDVMDRPLLMSLIDIEKQVASNLGLLGFTPADRTRLGVAEVAKTTKLDEMLRRRRERDQPVEQAVSAGSSSLEEEKT